MSAKAAWLRLRLILWYSGTDRDAAPLIQKLCDGSGALVRLPRGTYTIYSSIVVADAVGVDRNSGSIFVQYRGGGDPWTLAGFMFECMNAIGRWLNIPRRLRKRRRIRALQAGWDAVMERAARAEKWEPEA